MYGFIKEFINKSFLNADKTFSRQELLGAIHLPNSNYNYVSTVINYFKQGGFLRPRARGIYQVMKEVPENLSLNELLVIAYPENKKIQVKAYKSKINNLSLPINERRKLLTMLQSSDHETYMLAKNITDSK